MRFYVERNILTDDTGKVVPADDPTRISYTIIDGVDGETAVRAAAADADTEILFDVYRMSPEQAMATVRQGRRVLTIHAFPEEEAQDRIIKADTATDRRY
ncbi:MAG TPA: hypothetical protein VF883_03995 [Thermoanaerobaculia bacterium]|jgi:hypothetical protein